MSSQNRGKSFCVPYRFRMASLAAAGTPTIPPYQYLICIDFEATCDEVSEHHPELLVTRDEQEIIEFPWVGECSANCFYLFHNCIKKKAQICKRNPPVDQHGAKQLLSLSPSFNAFSRYSLAFFFGPFLFKIKKLNCACLITTPHKKS